MRTSYEHKPARRSRRRTPRPSAASPTCFARTIREVRPIRPDLPFVLLRDLRAGDVVLADRLGILRVLRLLSGVLRARRPVGIERRSGCACGPTRRIRLVLARLVRLPRRERGARAE